MGDLQHCTINYWFTLETFSHSSRETLIWVLLLQCVGASLLLQDAQRSVLFKTELAANVDYGEMFT